MALTFPNRSRSYDDAHQRVRFIGHDGMFEVPFFIEVDAFSKPSSSPSAEADYLAAFDAAVSSIHNVAREAYSNTRKNMYVLTSGDFR
ncbi:DUF1488 domain-containing protein [Phyllobacterium salinisoli]|uniref:DUF1488 domain-containing protein n=1 Tax=Phyllobacterium salinisoli TaxID=1899321 RepID=A0A368K8R9_9HYPH|nr:DUF1488 domain-containing protein [Phyllobacterium salinisoli]RCS25621.1 DUF1488 domain-containing protein [Phyllobacterium salinisoli]